MSDLPASAHVARRRTLCAAAALALAGFVPALHAQEAPQNWPSKGSKVIKDASIKAEP